MLLDNFVRSADATRVERRRVHGPCSMVYEVALHTDFIDAARRHLGVRTLFAVRTAAERLVTVLRGRHWEPPNQPASLTLFDIPNRGNWVRLAEDAGNEFAFGAIGRFWAGETKWVDLEASEFAAFSQPGYAKIGANLTLHPLGDSETRIAYEARTVATDEASRRAFLRYWRVVSPFVGIIMRSLLTEIKRNVEQAQPLGPLAHGEKLAHK